MSVLIANSGDSSHGCSGPVRRLAAALVLCSLLVAGLSLIGSSQAAAQASDSWEPFARRPSLDFENLGFGVIRAHSTDVWSDGETLYVNYWAFPGRRTKILAYDFASGERLPGRDINLGEEGNGRWNIFPWGLWSDGSTMYVSDEWARRVFAYSLEEDSYGDYLPGSSLSLRRTKLESYAGMWSDGTTMWVAKRLESVVEGYDLATRQWDSTKDFTTLAAAGNRRPFGIWSDGTTMWVSDEDDKRIYAYDMATKQRQRDLEFDTLDAAGSDRPAGIWSDGTTMWVSEYDYRDSRAYAYAMPSGLRLELLEVSGVELTRLGLDSFEGRVPRTMASVTVTAVFADGSHPVTYSADDADDVEEGFQWALALGENTLTVTVSDGTDSRDYTLRVLRVDVDALTDDASLSSLTVGGESVEGLSADVTDYRVRVANSVTSVTVAAVPTVAQAQVTLAPDDADAAEGYQVSLAEGLSMVTVEVTATDGTVGVYTLVVGREPSAFGRDEFWDLEGLGPHHSVDVWGDGATWWVAYDRRGDGAVDEVLAYDAVTGERDPDKDVTSLNGESVGNMSPQALWSSGSSLWVLDAWKSKVFRYSLADANYGAHVATGARLEGIGEDRARGLWSNGATTWVIDTDEDRVYAYDSDSGARDDGEDFDTLAAAGNEMPYDLWSDGAVMWVLDKQDQRIYAYDMSSKQRLEDFEFAALDPDNDWPSGIWSDADTMWVSDYDDHRAYAYAMPTVTRLETLAVADAELRQRGSYSFEAHVTREVDTVTVTAVATDESHPVTYSIDDADDAEKGFQWDLALGENTLTVTVSDGTDSRSYTVTLVRVDADELSDDASLSSLTVDGAPVEGFSADVADYRLRVGNDVVSVTVAAMPTVSQARVTVTPEDADTADDYQVVLVEGRNTVSVEVTATDGTVSVYTLVVSREPSALGRDEFLDVVGLGTRAEDLWSDGETWWVAYDLPGSAEVNELLAYEVGTGERDRDKDITSLTRQAVRNLTPQALWSNGDQMWVMDRWWAKVYRYSLRDANYGTALSVATRPGDCRNCAQGLWSDGSTVWVINTDEDRIEAFDGPNAARRQRIRSEDFDTLTAAGNQLPYDMWSNGHVMWVLDRADLRIYAYDMVSKQRLEHLEFAALDPANASPSGIWSDGDTMWVTDRWNRIAFAYRMPEVARIETLAVSGVELTQPGLYRFEGRVPRWVATVTVTAVPVGGSHQVTYSADDADAVEEEFQWDLALGENTLTVAVSDGIHTREYTLRVLKIDVDELSDDASLASLSLSDVDFGSFDSATLGYAATVAAGTGSTTVTAAASDEGAEVTITPEDAYLAEGYQVGLVEGVTVVRVEVESSDGTASRVYSVEVTRPSVAVDGWGVFADIDSLAASNRHPRDVWSDGTTMWVSDIGDDRLYAYDLDTMARAADRDLNGLGAAGNRNANGIWSDCSTMWVSDDSDDKIYAYRLDTGERDRGRDISTLNDAVNETHNRKPRGMWSNATTMWVADSDDNKIYAYHLGSRARKPGSDINGLGRAGNTNPTGIWSDGVTMWVADVLDAKIYAYRLATGERDSVKDFDTLEAAGNRSPKGIWSNGVTMWVSDNVSGKIYSYNMPLAGGVRALEFSGIDLHFSRETLSYTVQVGHDVESTTVTAVPVVACADVDVSPDDADSGTEGHQVDLAVGDTSITVTATVGSLSTVYTATVTRAPAAGSQQAEPDQVEPDQVEPDQVEPETETQQREPGSQAEVVVVSGFVRDAGSDVGLVGANRSARGVWSDGVTLWVSDSGADRVFAYVLASGERDGAKDVVLGNAWARGIWSDGTTLWVADPLSGMVFAYVLATGVRDRDKDVVDLGANTSPAGVWSDGEALWVSASMNFSGRRVFAYGLESGELLLDAAVSGSEVVRPWGLWSDGVTMWVADPVVDKLLAYGLVDGARVAERDVVLAEGNGSPQGIWSDGSTLWVVDGAKLFAYTAVTATVTPAAAPEQQGSQPEPGSQPQPEPGSQPEPDSQPQPEPGSQPEPDSQPQPEPGSQQLTAGFEDVPASHSGSGSITVRVAFSEPVSTSYVTMRDDSFEVAGATVTGARRVSGRSDLWELTLAVGSTGDIIIALPARPRL